MSDNRCPSCQNDVSHSVRETIVALLRDGDSGTRSFDCPHCGESLSVTANVTTRLQKASALS